MLKSKQKFLITLCLLFVITITPLLAYAYSVTDIINQLDVAAQKSKIIEDPQSAESLYGITGRFIFLFLGSLSAIFLLLIIFAGISWMMAAGNEEKIKKARTTMVHATIGLIIVLAAFLITNFVVFQLVSRTTPG